MYQYMTRPDSRGTYQASNEIGLFPIVSPAVLGRVAWSMAYAMPVRMKACCRSKASCSNEPGAPPSERT